MVQHGKVDIAAPGEGHPLSIAYSETGKQEGPLLLFVHGLGVWRETWMQIVECPAFEDIRRRYRCIAIDLPGFGDSGDLTGDYYIEGMALVVAKVIEALGEEKAIIVGNSLGGSIALSLALNVPECVEAIVVQGPPISGDDFRDIERTILDWWLQKSYRIPELIEDFPVKLHNILVVANPLAELSWRRVRSRRELARLGRFTAAMVRGSLKHNKRAYHDLILDLFHCELKSRLGEIEAPTLIIDGHPLYRPVRTLDELDRGIQNAVIKHVVQVGQKGRLIPFVGGPGHLVPFTNVGAFVEALDVFLADVEELLSQ